MRGYAQIELLFNRVEQLLNVDWRGKGLNAHPREGQRANGMQDSNSYRGLPLKGSSGIGWNVISVGNDL